MSDSGTNTPSRVWVPRLLGRERKTKRGFAWDWTRETTLLPPLVSDGLSSGHIPEPAPCESPGPEDPPLAIPTVPSCLFSWDRDICDLVVLDRVARVFNRTPLWGHGSSLPVPSERAPRSPSVPSARDSHIAETRKSSDILPNWKVPGPPASLGLAFSTLLCQPMPMVHSPVTTSQSQR